MNCIFYCLMHVHTHVLHTCCTLPLPLLLCTNLSHDGAGVLVEGEEVHTYLLVYTQRQVIALVLAAIDEGPEGKGTRCSHLWGGRGAVNGADGERERE